MRIISLIIAVITSSISLAQDVFVDEGACPGEGCVYGERWVAVESARLWSIPDSSSQIIRIVRQNEVVQTLTGQVHTIPGRFIVHRAYKEFTPGDDVFLYTYLGEGWFRLRHNGELKEAELYFGPWGGSSGKRCEIGTMCWGRLQQELQFEWWIKIRTKDGTEYWTLDSDKFN